MKILCLLFICITCMSFKVPDNVNSWILYLNGRQLMLGYGSMTLRSVELHYKDLKPGDTLGVLHNLCGDFEHSAGYVTELIFCDSLSRRIKSFYNSNTRREGYRAEMPATEILNRQLNSFKLYSRIDSKDSAGSKTLFICRVVMR